jgi:predicted DNA-binding transcriptional regulator AlpA
MPQQLPELAPAGKTFTAPEIFLCENQVAELLQVSRRSVQRWRGEGRGPRFRRHGSTIRYTLTDVLRWSEANAANSTSEVAA